MTEINGQLCRIKNKRVYDFQIELDTTKFNKYESSGSCENVKQPKTVQYQSYA
jgi:hypothetical protein